MLRIRLLLLLYLPVFLLTGCSKEDAGMDTLPLAVQFCSGNPVHSRTNESGDEWELHGQIGIYMISNNSRLSDQTIVNSSQNMLYFARSGGKQTTFTPAYNRDTIFYMANNHLVDFIAYYPYKIALTDYTYPINASDQRYPQRINILYSNNAKGYNKYKGTVILEFVHVMSKLNFTLVSGTGAPDLTGATLQISNVATTATMDLADGEVTPTNSGQTLTVPSTNSAIVIPQTLTNAKLTVTLKDGKNKFDWSFTTSEWEKGKEYPYIITVSKKGIAVSTGNITDWEGKDDPPIEGGAGYKVGDYYPDPKAKTTDGGTTWTGTKPIGVVFWVDPADSRHGKIVGLQEKSSVNWGPDNVTTRAVDWYNGLANMQTIYKLDNTFAAYPAFAWVHSQNPLGTDYSNANAKGVWYLLVQEELGYLSSSQIPVNAALTAAGGTELKGDYWCSTEFTYADAFAGFSGVSNKLKNKNLKARCILAF